MEGEALPADHRQGASRIEPRHAAVDAGLDGADHDQPGRLAVKPEPEQRDLGRLALPRPAPAVAQQDGQRIGSATEQVHGRSLVPGERAPELGGTMSSMSSNSR